MGLFFAYNSEGKIVPNRPIAKLNVLNELDINGQPQGDDNNTEDYTAAEPEAAPAQNQPAQEQEPQNPPAEGEQTPDAEQPANEDEPTPDYTEMDDNADYENDEGGEAPPDEPQTLPVDDNKAQEEELLSDLTTEELDLKHKELKSKYMEMYTNVSSIIDRIGDASVSEKNIKPIEYSLKQLNSLKDMIVDYVNDIYHLKSYTENLINYNRFLAVLGGINKILEVLNSEDA